MEDQGFSFEEFSVEMQSFDIKKTNQFDRLWGISDGGSIDQWPLVMNGKVYFGSFNHNVYCVNASDGKLVWKFRSMGKIGISSPVAHEGTVYVGSYDQNVYALDAGTGELRWKFKTDGEILSTPAILDGTLFFGSKDMFVYAVDARTGALKWKFRTLGELITCFTPYKDRIMFGSYDRNYYCCEAATGNLIWKLKADYEIINNGPYAMEGKHSYLFSFDNFLRKVDVETGEVVWKKRFGQYGGSNNTVRCGDMILLPSRDANLFAVDLDGNLLWKFQTNEAPMGSPTVCDGRIYVGSEDKNFYCLSMEGKLLWKFRTFEMNWWKPTISDGTVFFSSYDCHMYALNASTGDLIWKFRTEGSPSYIPPPHESFEVEMQIKNDKVEEENRKSYDMESFSNQEEIGGAYKSRITYGVSSQYAKKSSYSTGSGDEDF